MKLCLAILSLSILQLLSAPVPTTKQLYRTVCPDCGATNTIHPKWVGATGGFTQPDGSIIKTVGMRFKCKCGDSFMVERRMKVMPPTAVEVAEVPAAKLSSPKAMSELAAH